MYSCKNTSDHKHKQGAGSHDERISFTGLDATEATKEEFRQIIGPVMSLNKRVIDLSFNVLSPGLTTTSCSCISIACQAPNQHPADSSRGGIV